MSSYYFNQTSLKSDPASLQRYQNQNQDLLGYLTMNPAVARLGTWLRGGDGMQPAMDLATDNKVMQFKGQGVPKAQLDTKNALEYGFGDSMRPKGKQELQPRAFHTTPFFGDGTGPQDVDQETVMRLAAHHRQPKSVGTVSDKTNTYPIAPLLADKKADLATTSHFIEADADPSLVRGGANTRAGQHKML